MSYILKICNSGSRSLHVGNLVTLTRKEIYLTSPFPVVLTDCGEEKISVLPLSWEQKYFNDSCQF